MIDSVSAHVEGDQKNKKLSQIDGFGNEKEKRKKEKL